MIYGTMMPNDIIVDVNKMRKAPGLDLPAIIDRIQEARELAGFSVNRLGSAIGLAQGSLSRILNKQRPRLTLEIIADIARELGESLDWITYGVRASRHESTDSVPDVLRKIAKRAGYSEREVDVAYRGAPASDDIDWTEELSIRLLERARSMMRDTSRDIDFMRTVNDRAGRH